MDPTISRRAFLSGATVLAAMPSLNSRTARAEQVPVRLRATRRTLDVNGRAATVFGLLRNDGGHGIELGPNERFRVRLVNTLDEPTIIHWHGQIPPVAQDGVPDAPLPMLVPGEAREFDYVPRPGTHWMHAHVPPQEMRLLAAPLIVRTEEDLRADRQEVVIMLHDFSFTPLAEHLARLNRPEGHGAANHHASMPGMGGMAGMAMDLNDIDFDAYLANDRTLADPEVVRVEPGGRVLLRIINGAGATVFWIDTGRLRGVLVAVDGDTIQTVAGSRVGLAMGQRADIVVEVPREGGAFPILALREGERERTGIVLATAGATISRVAPLSETPAEAFGAAQEMRLQAGRQPARRRADVTRRVTLDGTMSPYEWSIDGRPWGRHQPIPLRSGQRVELVMENRSMMAHPMHLHGHVFQVVQVGDHRFPGAVRDTVHVPPMTRIAIAFDAGEVARWMFHCHHMPHLATGMMTEVTVEG
jgi:FtsP/CotA-like multicopper oxidase with cupredoxin domain